MLGISEKCFATHFAVSYYFNLAYTLAHSLVKFLGTAKVETVGTCTLVHVSYCKSNFLPKTIQWGKKTKQKIEKIRRRSS